MRKYKIMQICLAVCLTVIPYSIYAAGLGKLDVSSGLGEPLKAEIELLLVSPDELSTLVASIASEEAYAAQGIPHLGIHNSIKVELVKNVAGTPMLKLISNQPISDPYLDLLIQVDWATGRLLREYTVLLDPPGYKPTDDVLDNPLIAPSQSLPSSVIPSSASESNSVIVGERSRVKKIRKSKEPVPQDNIADDSEAQALRTKRGDTLSSLAKELQVEGVSLDQMLIGLYESNQEAFFSKNMNRLKVGQIIKVPTKESLIAISTLDAKQAVRLHSDNWNAYRNHLAGSIAVASATTETEQKQSSSGKISPAEDKAMPTKVGPQDVVKLSAGVKPADKSADDKMIALQEEATAREKSLKEAEARSLALEKQIQDMQKLLALKNQSMANLQKKSATVTKPPPTPQPQAEPSMLGSLMNLTLLSGALIAGLLVASWLFLRNKRRKESDTFGSGIIASGDLRVNTQLGHVAGEGNTSNANDVDPIAEAEVYMAYGRDTQAEDILKEAILKEPTLYERHLKLLEIYVARPDLLAFKKIAKDLHNTLVPSDPVWVKVAELGASIDPENSLYDLSYVALDDAPVDKALEATDFSDDAISKSNDLDFSMDTGSTKIPEAESNLAEVVADAATDNLMDFDLGDIAVEAPLEPLAMSPSSELPSIEPVQATNIESQEAVLDFSSITDVSQTQTSDLDMDLNSSVVEDVIADAQESDSNKNIADEIAFDLDFSIEPPNPAVENLAEANASALSFELPQAEETTINTAEDKSQSSELEANRFDLSSISFDLDDTENELIEEAPAKQKKTSSAKSKKVLLDSPEVDVKLDLVLAYIDMGDKEGARELLAEITKEGGAKQKLRAQELLDSIA